MSCTATNFFIFTMPVSRSTATSAICTPATPELDSLDALAPERRALDLQRLHAQQAAGFLPTEALLGVALVLDAAIPGDQGVGADLQLIGDQLFDLLQRVEPGMAARFGNAAHRDASARGRAVGKLRAADVDLDGLDGQSKRFGQHDGEYRSRAGAQVLAAGEHFDAAVGMDLDGATRRNAAALPGVNRHAQPGDDRTVGRTLAVQMPLGFSNP